MDRAEILHWLCSRDPGELFRRADELRRKELGDEVHFRGIIEFSNHCRRSCQYCGINIRNKGLERYRMTPEQVVALALEIVELGVGTVVLQSGEDPRFSTTQLLEVITAFRGRSTAAVTLSVGELPREDYFRLRNAGADRFLMRFETSDPRLYARLHDGKTLEQRLESLAAVRAAGFQVGTGFLVGLPGQDPERLAEDILLTEQLQPQMIGIGPFIAHPETPLAAASGGSLELSLKVVALLRLTNPRAHIPATTALDALSPQGRELALQCGANVIMPNFTPSRLRRRYLLYPGKPQAQVGNREQLELMRRQVKRLGRRPATGRGDALPTALPR